jgi:hypothetical protein
MERRLRVTVQPGMFPSERTVSFEAGGRNYTLVVDERDVAADGTLVVHVVDQRDDEALVDLPRETFTSGSRVRIPRSVLLPA